MAITKPTIGGSRDIWGIQNNAALDQLDAASTANATAIAAATSATLTSVGGNETTRLAAFLATPGLKRLKGNFTVSDIITPASDIIVDGREATITQTANLKAIFRTEGASNLTIERLTCYGKTTDYVDSSAVYDASAVYVSGASTNVVIESCQFLNFAGAGVNVLSTAGVVSIRNNRMTGAPAQIEAERIAQGPVAEVNSGCGVRGLTELALEIRGNDISGFAQGILTAKGATDLRIVDNYIHDITFGQHGAYLSLVGGRLMFTGNVITGCHDNGMKVQIADPVLTESADILISDNVITNTGGPGIAMTNIETVAPDSDVKNRRVSITGNVMTNNSRGIQIHDTVNAVIANNVISNVPNNAQGIDIDNSSELTIANNRLTNITGVGLRIAGTSNSLFVGNVITDPATTGTASNNFGVQMTGACPDLVFDGNRVTSATAAMFYGFYFNHSSGIDTLTVRNNYGVGTHATGYGARFASATAIREYQNNEFSGVSGRVLNPPTEARGFFGRQQFAAAAPTAGAYRVGDRIWNTAPSAAGTLLWVCTTVGNAFPIWVASTAYVVSDTRKNGTRNYVVTTAGTSAASGGPTGTGTGIADGTVVWDYVAVAPVFTSVTAS